MDFNTVYAQKLTTADRVAALVKDDDWVDYGWAIGTPVSFDAALAKRLPELHGIKFRGGILCHVPEIFKIENQAEHFCWNSWHMGGIERKAVAAGYAYYSPLRYSELPRYYRESPDPLNIAVFVVAPMDSHGYFNLGPCASHLADAARKADKVFVEVNKNMPVCLGGYDNCLHISQVDGIIEGDNPPIDQLGGGGAPTEVDQAVARLVVDRIPNALSGAMGNQMYVATFSTREEMEQFYSDVLAVNDPINARVQKELTEVLALGEPTAVIPKPDLTPAVKPTTAVAKTSRKSRK